MVGDALFGPGNGRIFMLCEAFTVFLAMIGTTLSCMNTGARVTYAMGKDRELHGPLRRVAWRESQPASRHLDAGHYFSRGWYRCVIDALWRRRRPVRCNHKALPHGFWSSFGYTDARHDGGFAQFLLTVTLASNFGTFLLYGLSCIICVVAYHNHPKFSASAAFVCSGLRLAGQSSLHGVLSDWPVYGLWHEDGAAARLRHRFGLGSLWGNLLHPRK